MYFNEKLDFLMNITKTTNSALSNYISLDASHISRLRRGERKLVKDADYIKKMAIYFTRQCIDSYQKKALLDIWNEPISLFDDAEKVAKCIYTWLIDDVKNEDNFVVDFPDDARSIQFNKSKNTENSLYHNKESHSELSLYYGIEGKREAILRFLSSVLEIQEPQTLLLYSDESMEWLTDDSVFAAKWTECIINVIKKGHRIKIIHTVSRNLDEMLEALSKWIPLYMTGSIMPYYYPKKRDGIFKRTIFVVPDFVALTATSIDIMTEKTVNMLLFAPKAVNAIAEEFNSYLNLCKPLIRVFNPKDQIKYINLLYEFEDENADAILKGGPLSLVTLPFSVAEAMIERSNISDKDKIKNFFLNRQQWLENSLHDNRFCEILRIPSILDIKEGKVEVGMDRIQESSAIYYSPHEYRKHLENIVQLLHKYDNYQVVLCKDNKEDEYRLYAKEDLGVIVIKITAPYASFALNESNMTAAVWDYLTMIYNEYKTDKEMVISQLQQLIDNLK